MMNIELEKIEQRVAGEVTRAYESVDVPHYAYHNLTHTRAVVGHCRELAAHYSLGNRGTFVLVVAAWFHDIGHLYGEIEGHEQRGVVRMKDCLSDLPAELIGQIAACILATKVPSHPGSLSEKIICDADTFHFGTPEFRRTDALVHQEVELRKGIVITDWPARTLTVLRRHVFFTDYCQMLLTKGKEENIAWVEARLR